MGKKRTSHRTPLDTYQRRPGMIRARLPEQRQSYGFRGPRNAVDVVYPPEMSCSRKNSAASRLKFELQTEWLKLIPLAAAAEKHLFHTLLTATSW